LGTESAGIVVTVTRIVRFHFVRHLALDPIGERGEGLNIPF
jgi:hypothetical protein